MRNETLGKIKIVTDSTVDLDEDVIKKYDIEVVPLSIHINGKTYLDRKDINPYQFMEMMKQSEELPKSSQPAIGVFVELYNRLYKEGYDVISIHMTSGMSGTYHAARQAAEMAEGNVIVIDSRFISRALAFQVIEAAKLALSGKSKEYILEALEKIRQNTRLFVYVETLENLIKGGRIGKGKGMIGSLLKIKPIASLEDGVYTPVTKVRIHTQAVKYLANAFAEDVKGKIIKGVAIAHADGLEITEKLIRTIKELTDYDKVEVTVTTPIVSTHTGLGAIGFMYYFE